MCSCANKQDNIDRSSASELYKDQKQILLAYIDTIQHSQDSAAIIRVATTIEDVLANSAEKYEADADFKLTYAQQDTLTILSNKFINIRNSRFPNIVKTPKFEIDSLNNHYIDKKY